MSQALQSAKRISADDYLAFENESEMKHEFVDGVIYAMVGATDRHNLIAFTLASDIFQRVSPPCQVFQGQMKLKVSIDAGEVFYYPDVMVSCSPDDRSATYRERPNFLCEVLSPSTERTDRKEKLFIYQQIPSVQEYVIISQDVPQIEVFRRRSVWQVETFLMADVLTLECLGLKLPVAEIYRSVTF